MPILAMSVEKIVEKILTDAKAEAERILEEARREADRIRAQGEQEALAAQQPILRGAEMEAQRRRLMHLSLAQLEARNKILAARRQALDQVFAEAAKRLAALKDQEYWEFLRRLLIQAAETGEEEILLSPQDRARLNANFLESVNAELIKMGKKGALRIAQENRDLSGGFVLRGQGYEANVSLSVLLRQAKESLESEVASILFES